MSGDSEGHLRDSLIEEASEKPSRRPDTSRQPAASERFVWPALPRSPESSEYARGYGGHYFQMQSEAPSAQMPRFWLDQASPSSDTRGPTAPVQSYEVLPSYPAPTPGAAPSGAPPFIEFQSSYPSDPLYDFDDGSDGARRTRSARLGLQAGLHNPEDRPAPFPRGSAADGSSSSFPYSFQGASDPTRGTPFIGEYARALRPVLSEIEPNLDAVSPSPKLRPPASSSWVRAPVHAARLLPRQRRWTSLLDGKRIR